MSMQRVHLHIKYIERSDELYKTKDITEFVHSRLSMQDEDREPPKSKDGILQIYITEPEAKVEIKKSSNKRKNKRRKNHA